MLLKKWQAAKVAGNCPLSLRERARVRGSKKHLY
jgi:hypothetical protein